MSRTYDSELTGSRAEIAAVLEGVVDGLLSGSVRLGGGADAVTFSAPADLSLEIEFETEDDEVSLELELEWDDPDGSDAVAVSGTETDADASGTETDADASGTETATDAPDGETNEGAASETDALSAHAGAADASQSLARFEVFRDRREEWRWRLRHRNGNIIATSGEGYTQKHNAWKGLRSVMQNAPEAELTEDARTE